MVRNILSLDGGGIRALAQATFLSALEARVGHLADAFHLIAGTSAGGINALMLTHPARFPAQEVVNLYAERGAEIFHRSLFRKFLSLGGVLASKYPASGIETVLKSYMGDATLAQARTKVLVAATDYARETDVLFRSDNPQAATVKMWEAARASSAAPTYFPPFGSLVDGGLVANNPSAVALAAARELWPNDEYVLVSVGTGRCSDGVTPQKARTWGLLGWARVLIGVILTSDARLVNDQVGRDLGPNFVRIQEQLPRNVSGAIDDASPKNVQALKDFGDQIVKNNQSAIRRISSLLRH